MIERLFFYIQKIDINWHSHILTLETTITKSYKNTQNVRRFFRLHLGDDFHFNREFMAWIKADSTHRFIDLYTDHGGTDGESHDMVKLLNEQHIPYLETEETQLTPQPLRANRIVYIHSLHEHNNIVNSPDNFRLFLENEPFLGKVKE